MSCTQAGAVTLCAPPQGIYRRAYLQCPECDRRHGFVIRWAGAWYGEDWNGLCGDTWNEDGRGYRPFARGWRERAQRRASAMWAVALPRDLYDAYCQADIRQAVTPFTDDVAQSAAAQRMDEVFARIDARRAGRQL